MHPEATPTLGNLLNKRLLSSDSTQNQKQPHPNSFQQAADNKNNNALTDSSTVGQGLLFQERNPNMPSNNQPNNSKNMSS